MGHSQYLQQSAHWERLEAVYGSYTAYAARVTTTTDLYSTFGQTVPDAPYSAPSTATFNVTDANGNPVLNTDGSAQTVTTDTSVLLGNQPSSRTASTSNAAADSGTVTNRWKVRGAYYTFRAGPTVFIPVTGRLKASLSLGAAVAYAGSTYTVFQSFTPDTGAAITDTSENTTSRLLPGYFADASLQFDLTERKIGRAHD